MKKNWIITAMREEAEHIIKLYDLKKTNWLLNIEVYENDKIVLALCWIWKIQSSIWTSFLLENYDIDKFINIWIAGSLLFDNANIGDIFIVGTIIQHDMYLPFEWSHLDYAKKEINIKNYINISNNFDFNLKAWSICLTWDQFIDDKQKVLDLRDKYNADVIEMEAFSIASVLREYNKLDNFICIKAISDGADSEAKDDHMWNLDFAMKNSIEVLKEIISSIN